MRFGPTSFSDDTELTEPISSLGPLTARGSLYANIVKVNGPCVIGENLEINESLKVNGPLTIDGTLTGIADANIKVNGPATSIRNSTIKNEKRQNIYTIQSPPLKDIIFRLNKSSVNLYAEQLIKILGKKIKGVGSIDKGIETIKEWLKKNEISTKGIFIHDGSGLSRSNGCTTRFFVELLSMMSRDPAFKILYDSLPIAGNLNDEGNLKRMCIGTAAANNVHAKTGTMERVRCHSGYVHSKSGELICFSIMANNYIGKSLIIDKCHESIMVLLAEIL